MGRRAAFVMPCIADRVTAKPRGRRNDACRSEMCGCCALVRFPVRPLDAQSLMHGIRDMLATQVTPRVHPALRRWRGRDVSAWLGGESSSTLSSLGAVAAGK